MNKMFKINGNPEQYKDLDVFHKLAQQFLPYAQQSLGFDKPVGVNLLSDPENVKDPLGKTAYYDPNKMEITLFVDKRHVKDILRSMAHELVHHTQNCRGEFDGGVETGPGYAQDDEHMRKMEAEAYLKGSGFLLRDWEDSLKENKTMSKRKLNEEQMNVQKYGSPNLLDPPPGKEKEYAAKAAAVGKRLDAKMPKFDENINEEENDKKKKKKDGMTIDDVPETGREIGEPTMEGDEAHVIKPRTAKEKAKEKALRQSVKDKTFLGKLEENEEEEEVEEEEDLVKKAGEAAKRAGKVVKKAVAKKAAKDAAERIFPAKDVAKVTKDDEDDDKQVAKPGLDEKRENWTRGNKDQLLFERLVEKWTK